MTDIYDLATEAEEKDRARALAIALRVAEAPRPMISLPVSGRFRPPEPKTLEEAGLEPEFVQGLMVK